MRSRCVAAALAVLVACTQAPIPGSQGGSSASVRVLFGGDVMLGRAVAPVWTADHAAPLAGLRATLVSADVAMANLESPLTGRAHLVGSDRLEASPEAAHALAIAGFDAMSIANNHASDAGPGTVADTSAALGDAGLQAIGLGSPVLLRRQGLDLVFLAFDATGGATSPVAAWDPAVARHMVAEARAQADFVAVSLHGGQPYSSLVDPFLARQARRLAGWGADVVWCHGPHVVQPIRVIDPDGDGRSTVVATSLGNLLFDQNALGRDRGALLEVRADEHGVIAYREARTRIHAGAVDLVRWRQPDGDAVAFDRAWWTPVRAVVPVGVPQPRARLLERLDDSWTIELAIKGDADGDPQMEIVVLARVPFERAAVHAAYDSPRRIFVDERGRIVRLAVYERSMQQRWIASMIARPLAGVAACAGSLAVSYRTLDRPEITGTGLWVWVGFGFGAPVDLPGPGVPGCADVDGDGRPEPVITGRRSR